MEISHNILKLFGIEFNLWIVIMSWVVMAILIAISWFASRNLSWIPKGWQNVMEMFIEFIQNLIRNSFGESGIKYTYFFGSLFLFILISNMLGLIPGFQSPTRDLNITACLALVWLIWMQYVSIRENGVKGYFKHYFEPFPPFVLIHLLEMCTRPLTLAMRLFGNIFAGEILLETLTKQFGLIVPDLWIFVSIAIGGIQAFIFTVLTVSYTGLAVSHEDKSEH
jgi:F-type H+-transporting ATPase subunit a